ncbi:LysR substrate-binding domain-containing protein [Paraburkholderia sp. BR10882]|uniref:LysR substrate-binding domain-containing protein n=1 Tax=unclassified Paraburkholderia TaxID=2615204 RepID=UPI0034CED03B
MDSARQNCAVWEIVQKLYGVMIGLSNDVSYSLTIKFFRSDGVDIAVRLGKPPFAKGLVSDPLFPLQVFGVASPQLLKPDRPVRTISDLQNYVLLHDSHDLWPEFFNALGCTYDVGELKGPHFSQSSLAIDAAIAGQGIAHTSEHLVERDISALNRAFAVSKFCATIRIAVQRLAVRQRVRTHSSFDHLAGA